jgi:aspartyl-tRNA(Asn)/glutamyl-tRNA(Gln) amidotransferase subunit A
MADLGNISSIQHIQAGLKHGAISMVGLVSHYLDRIQHTEEFNIYVRVFRQESLDQAAALDKKLKEGETPGKLFGVVASIKDVICYAGHQVTAGSKMLSGYESPFSATAVKQLLDEDAIIIGMVNCDEFAMGSSNENSFYGPTKNGHHPAHVPGGSSGASAVSVQLDTCLISLGSDTGGSVRQPAAFCNIIGMKPSYGRVSRYGLIAYASSFDQIGVLGKNISDIGLVLEVISGTDQKDSTTSLSEFHMKDMEHALPRQPSIAYFSNAFSAGGVQKEIEDSFLGHLDQLREDGCTIHPIDFPLLEYMVSTYYILTMAEASSNLSRFDGVRYGYRAEETTDLDDLYGKSRSEGFGIEVKRRIMLGAFVLSSGYYDAYFQSAQKVRRKIVDAIDEIFTMHDFIVLPTVPETAWKIGEKMDDPVAVYLSDIFTVLANLCGIPAISIPLGQDREGLSFGLQIMSKRFSEAQLLAFSTQLNANS